MCGILLAAVGSPAAAADGAAGYDKPAPESIDDLRQIERRVTEVAAAAGPATVALDLGLFGTGSGVVVSEDGVILTAAHVIGEAGRRFDVRFPDGTVAKARTLGSDRQNDSGMAKLEGDGPWPFVPLAEPDAARRGDWVVALGHPGGFDAERPVVVRLGRVIRVRPVVGIQTDCSLIGGDSGGPLLNLDGEVVGIHSRIGQSSRTNIHVAVGDYVASWDRLFRGREWGERRMPLLGVVFTPDEEGRGVRIDRVIRGSAAARAGVRRGDLLTRMGVLEIRDSQTVMEIMALQAPGDTVELTLLRGGREVVLDVQLGEWE
ncbi:MAG: S1C family serine protease [Planctomycetota bacterium]